MSFASLVGYDPQRLLTYQPVHFPKLWDEKLLREIMERPYSDWEDMWRTDHLPHLDVERWNEADSDPLADIEEWRKLMGDQPATGRHRHGKTEFAAEYARAMTKDGEFTFIVHEGGDFSVIEQYVLATLYHESAGGIHLDLPPAGEIEGFMVYKQSAGQLADFLRTDPEALDGPPVKQNGRSAAYLQHDPTKRHKRTKR